MIRAPIVFVSTDDHIDRVHLAVEIENAYPGLSFFLAWAEAGELQLELQAFAQTWDWEAFNAGNPEAL